MYMRVGVKPHLCLLIGGMVADVAVQREGAALPLAVFSHVTLEKVTAVHLKAADVTPEAEEEEQLLWVGIKAPVLLESERAAQSW